MRHDRSTRAVEDSSSQTEQGVGEQELVEFFADCEAEIESATQLLPLLEQIHSHANATNAKTAVVVPEIINHLAPYISNARPANNDIANMRKVEIEPIHEMVDTGYSES